VAKPIDTRFESGGDFVETGRNGPTVLVIGDSFTRGFWQDYFALHAGKYIWMHHELCGFAVSVVERYAPDTWYWRRRRGRCFVLGSDQEY